MNSMDETTNIIEKEKGHNILWIIIFFILVVTGISGFYLFSTKEVSENKEYIPSVSESRQILEAGSKLNLPIPEQKIRIEIGELDSELKFFVIDPVSDVEVNEVKYPDGSKGFTISFDVNKTILEIHNRFISIVRSNYFEVVGATRMNKASIIDITNSVHKIKIINEYVENDLTRILISTQSKE